ncbi:ABC-type amino acid transport substrate-binding protein [Rhizobium mesoamericanum]|uniref:transporter substrate-binding domain-containing protein n=1 Tax=Rhizobium mesoamericanum TaxID=1079800 RepID=UPI002788BDCE|nr:transporter substrate-binding domain-containing protein [Rhizobium mesoamericanum]MDQ0564462.1 ABC-type amino acid transport substrate-binding protein [Rhizobium mesoamericanum]
MKVQKLLMILGVVGIFVLAAQSASAKDTLKVGMDPLFEPFSFQTPDGELTGFDFEISNALCKVMDVTCDIQAVAGNGMSAALQAGQIDVLINTFAMTKERLEKFTMVGPYIRPTFRLITNANSSIDGSEASLKGKALGVETAPAIGKYSRDKFAQFMTVQPYGQINDAILDLNTGRVDAVFGDENQLYYGYVKKQPDVYKMVGPSVNDPEYFGTGQGFMLRKNEHNWAERLKTALDTIVQNGEYDKISHKWFGRNILNN